ncbi:MAG TPA: nucleotide exchange factor GrpE [Candidatus Acetothermia bacterium]|nr:nucleotide exchange factor GrpE [Candidatus Acetothermia bacterium]
MTEERDEPRVADEGAAVETGVSPDEIGRLRSDLVRLAADFDNYRKAVAREREILRERAWDEAARALLPVYDALQRALDAHAGEESELRHALAQLMGLVEEALRRLGCEGYDSVGKAFDPLYHEALLAEESDREKNVILAEFERGFLRAGRVIRPAKVKVSLGRGGVAT